MLTKLLNLLIVFVSLVAFNYYQKHHIINLELRDDYSKFADNVETKDIQVFENGKNVTDHYVISDVGGRIIAARKCHKFVMKLGRNKAVLQVKRLVLSDNVYRSLNGHLVTNRIEMNY